MTCACFILLATFLYPAAQKTHLLLWVTATVIVFLYRYSLILYFKKFASTTHEEKAGMYLVLFFTGLLLTGLCIGSSGFLFFPHTSVFHQVLLAFILCCTSILSMNSTMLSLWVAIIYPLLILFPATLVSIINVSDSNLLFGIMGIIFPAIQFFLSLELNSHFMENITIQRDTMGLSTGLTLEAHKKSGSKKKISEEFFYGLNHSDFSGWSCR